MIIAVDPLDIYYRIKQVKLLVLKYYCLTKRIFTTNVTLLMVGFRILPSVVSVGTGGQFDRITEYRHADLSI
jgi:hypothetical protein